MTMPGTLRIGLSRGRFEMVEFFRDKGAVIFTFSFPALLMLMLGGIYDEPSGGDVKLSQVFAASIAASAVVSTSFVNLGGRIAADRDDGSLKRLRGTPMPVAAYFIGKTVQVLLISLAELVLMLGLAMALYDLALPNTVVQWGRLLGFFVLGVICWSLLGIAASSLSRSAKTSAVATLVPYTLLGFVSGVYIVPMGLPPVMEQIGALFPLKWLAQGFRSALLPDSMAAYEAAGTWESGRVALVLGLWAVAGLVLCLTTFRWRDERTR
ncbi:ABC transporter permease [Phytomonospora sp. NPDC050363]|uniref:ABC transporter permease n=1 Tax=Phytomonospora sp. NPDC050363 TaxID=3155642 RepID=UPI0033E25BBA